MSDDIDQLNKLNSLRQSGALTEEEFTEQKRKLLQQSAPSKKNHGWFSWRSPKSWALGFGLLAVVMLLPAPDAAAVLPACNDKEIANMVVDVQNNYFKQHPIAYGALRATAVDGIKEIGANETTRACECLYKRSDGETKPIGFTVEWSNRNAGEYLVDTTSLDSLRAQFGK